jgi:hypothetical protein
LSLPPEAVELLAGGMTIYLATRAATLQPDCVMAYAVRDEGGGEVTVFLAAARAARTLENLRDNGKLALSMTRPSSNRSVQLKGTFVRVGTPSDEDRVYLERYRERFVDEMERVGVPRAFTARLPWWPTVPVVMRLDEVFLQTPGPEAGRRLVGAA